MSMWLHSLPLTPSLLHRECRLCRLSCRSPWGRLRQADKLQEHVQQDISWRHAKIINDACDCSTNRVSCRSNSINGWHDTFATTECRHQTVLGRV
jgi:hypothetical protein